MGCSYTVATRISTTNYQYMLSAGRYPVFLCDFLPCKHSVLLCQHLHSEMDT